MKQVSHSLKVLLKQHRGFMQNFLTQLRYLVLTQDRRTTGKAGALVLLLFDNKSDGDSPPAPSS